MSDPKDLFSSTEGTRVDLGEDLLERTAVIPAPDRSHEARSEPASVAMGVPSGPPAEFTTPFVRDQTRGIPEDSVENAGILRGEGLLEQAKKMLRRVLLRDPANVAAQQELRRIQDQELDKMLREDRPSRRGMAGGRPTDEEIDEIAARLEADLGGEVSPRYGLFDDAEAMERFARQLDGELRELSGRDRMDLGIAFLEMGLHSLAVRQFKAAMRDAEHEHVACALLAQALVEEGKAFEAIQALEPVIEDAELGIEEKIDFFYLMGRACERLGRQDSARGWYAQVHAIDPYYRDLESRLDSLMRGLAKEIR